ncbi:MAG: [Protein-PII] uridylyltransferase, partial [Myxococcaceae bacterium]|nr:[Protein-PII] uridylyltransferase [Myxococcaceae bacterium]
DGSACVGPRWKDPLTAEETDGNIGLGRRHAQILDAWLGTMFERARATVKPKGTYALAAVGSYGRGALALKSDIDVRLIVGGKVKDKDEPTAFSEAILYPLWDAGLSVGHQVMEPSEAIALAHDDLATTTSLLDLRHVASCAGGASLVDDLLRRAWEGLFTEANLGSFVDRLEEEAAARHERFGASVYLLEPDVKNGAGGIRDLDAVRWAARARFRVGSGLATDAAHVSGVGLWRELVRLGVLVTREAEEIERAEQLLWRVRNRLHAHAERRSDRLTFDEQESIAIELGYLDRIGVDNDVAPVSGENHEARAAAAERLMQDYYLQARAVTRARERIFERARPARRRARPVEMDIGGGVKLFDGHVTIGSSAELHSDPALALRVVAACVRHDAPILPFAREAIARAATDPAWSAALRANPEAARTFVDLICTVSEVRTRRGSIAGELHDIGLLLAMIPEFQPVTGRVHHDTYHVYTVDVHSVAAVDCLRALARGELAHIHPVASRLAAEMPRPRPVFLATLLHDVGKGYPDASGSRKNHSTSGAELCDTILPRLGLGPDEVAEARALVLQHLAMYHVATRRDLDDPSTVSEFARLVLGREGLKHLYLLTVVDISTTSPTAMTSWKSRMLEELYIATDAYLAGVKLSGIDEERVDRVREAARSFWQGPQPFFEEFLATMPDRYFLANAPDAIAAHAKLALERSVDRAIVRAAIVPSRHAEVAELCVIAEDRPGLLARISAAITAGRLEVLAAQVYSRTVPSSQDRTEAVDLFWVRDRVDGAEAAARALGRLVKDLEDVCTGAVDAEKLLEARAGGSSQWRERPSPAVVTEVVVEDRASPRHTVIEIFAKDRPGLLYTVARSLHDLGLSIALSKINTEGTRVADVFYVSELDGSKVLPGERFKAIRDALTSAIG